MSPAFPHLPQDAWTSYLEDGASAELVARIEAHLASCPECSEALMRADASRLFRLLREPAPPATWDGFWEELQPRLGPSPRARAARRRVLVGAAAAAALVIAAFASHRAARPPAVTDPCTQASLQKLRLTQEECQALYGGPIEDEHPAAVVREDLDLRGL